MKKALRDEIKKLCRKAFDKQKAEMETSEKYKKKFTIRTGIPAADGSSKGPTYSHRHFDPSHCIKNANVQAKAIWAAVLNGSYEPTPAIRYEIPKPTGGFREIMAFSIPDAALANVLFRATRDRNTKRTSPFSYAYQPDRNVFDAIIALRQFRPDGKLIAVQIDFEKYFDSIPRAYLEKLIDDEGTVSLTPHERFVFKAFMTHKYGAMGDFWGKTFQRRHKGTPQGNSVSLFLANLANDPLDKKLSRQAGRFVRFADDVVALCDRHEDAELISHRFEEHCESSGLRINRKKSPGIAAVSVHTQEIRTISEFKYLGYSLSGESLKIPAKKVRQYQQKFSRLSHIYLIQPLKFGFNPTRSSASGGYDWDLLGFISEVRRSIYGGLDERDIQKFLWKGHRLKRMQGLMGFYCILEDPLRLKILDGWMVNHIRRTMVHRNGVLKAMYGSSCPEPTNTELISGSWLNLGAWSGDPEDVEPGMPSFVRGWRAARKHYLTFGLEDVQPPQYGGDSGFSIII
ncbi:reverse transcriptase domain-containing protein [uncultured Roseobacter sp.]|uniref:reverse transcriptase domain-containing protein n=1 Tax=uncultured Roseobacter sp. TaxID=114847 RepID=UPI002638C873|nr:reverse transcriptase domain-containing protein [uncultured Roseobacter sp.]